MNAKKLIRLIMKERGHTYQSLADKLGYATPSGVSQRLISGSKDMRVDSMLSMLEAMDCELVVRSKLSDKYEWVVTGEEE